MTAPSAPSARSRLLPALAGWCRRVLAARRMRRAQAQQLAGMSEHELRDLGIGRSEIPALLDPAAR